MYQLSKDEKKMVLAGLECLADTVEKNRHILTGEEKDKFTRYGWDVESLYKKISGAAQQKLF